MSSEGKEASGDAISIVDGALQVPDKPVIPFIEGDGTGPDIWRSAQRVLDAAVQKAYGGSRELKWMEVLAGEKAFRETGSWLPEATLDAYRKYLVGIKGPLTTPIGGGIRSLNVALRQKLDLYVCLRPVSWYTGVPSPVKRPGDVDMVIFRENSEDIYAGIEFAAGSEEATKLFRFMQEELGVDKVRFPETSGFGIKPISEDGTKRLMRSAIEYALANGRKRVTIVHKGNIMKFTEGAFKNWSYEVAISEFRGKVVTQRESWVLGNVEANPGISVEDNAKLVEPGYELMTESQQRDVVDEVRAVLTSIGESHGDGKWKSMLMVNDAIADITLQQVLTRPREFDVIATMNLNGDYLSDALAAQIGGIGIAPGGNVNYITGHAIFEATHGTAPKYAGMDKVNPGSVILSGEMMLRYMGWTEAADLVVKGMNGAIGARTVTYDFHRQMRGEDAKLLKCSEFGDAVISHM